MKTSTVTYRECEINILEKEFETLMYVSIKSVKYPAAQRTVYSDNVADCLFFYDKEEAITAAKKVIDEAITLYEID